MREPPFVMFRKHLVDAAITPLEGLREYRPTLRFVRKTWASGSLAATPGAVTGTLFTSIKLALIILTQNPQKLRGCRPEGLEIVGGGVAPEKG